MATEVKTLQAAISILARAMIDRVAASPSCRHACGHFSGDECAEKGCAGYNAYWPGIGPALTDASALEWRFSIFHEIEEDEIEAGTKRLSLNLEVWLPISYPSSFFCLRSFGGDIDSLVACILAEAAVKAGMVKDEE